MLQFHRRRNRRNRRRRRPGWPRWAWALIVIGGVIVLAGLVLAVWRVPPLLYGYVTDTKDRANAEASTRTGLIAGLAGLAALGSLLVTSRTYRLTEQGQITDRYTKAIGQLGDDKLDVRLGGIYALERLAIDSERDHPTVVEVLSAYVRERSRPDRAEKPTVAEVLQSLVSGTVQLSTGQSSPEGGAHPITTDVQAALTVLGRLPARRGVSRGDLGGADLAYANLFAADLSDASLYGVDLTGAHLGRADLRGARLNDAILTNARLGSANLSDIDLPRADLTGAHLQFADLTRADLQEANLTGADLFDAILTDADVSGANLAEARNLTQAQMACTWNERTGFSSLDEDSSQSD